MATYYRWSQYRFTDEEEYSFDISPSNIYYTKKYLLDIPMPDAQWQLETGPISAPHNFQVTSIIGSGPLASAVFFAGGTNGSLYVSEHGEITSSTAVVVKRDRRFLGYVYSVNPNAYTSDIAISNTYVYAYRTTIQSPLPPASLNYPNSIVAPKAEISWPDSITNVPIYKVKLYEISYSTDNGTSWNIAGTTSQISYSFLIPTGTFSIRFRVRAQDSSNQWSDYVVGNNSTVHWLSTLTVPALAMQGQDITVNWTTIDTATSYTLQRKANTDDDWAEVYSGNALTFTETAGEWTTVQYRVQALFDGTPGGWATSASIPVVSASALVISGTDEDLGTLTEDVPYTVSSDTGNEITLIRTVNGVQVASLTVQSGFAYNIPVMDLPTGKGTIVISATVQATSGPVTATRTWTYTKAAFSFPGTGSTAQLQQEGKNVFPATLAECVRVGANLGGNLGLALQALANSVQYNPETGEVTIPGGGVAPIPRIETGSYVGTGTVGVGNPNSLNFNFTPKVVFIGKNDKRNQTYVTGYCSGPLVQGATFGYSEAPEADTPAATLILNWTTNGLTWYARSGGSYAQLNDTGYTYFYVAIG